MKFKRGFLIFLAIALIFNLMSFASAQSFSIKSLVENQWVNAFLLFVLVFNVVLFALKDVFKSAYGTAVIISLVVAVAGSFGVIYYYGAFLGKIGLWVAILFVIAIALFIIRLIRSKEGGKSNKLSGIIIIILCILGLAWLNILRRFFCPPLGNAFSDDICHILDIIVIIILIVGFFKLLFWLLGRTKAGTLGNLFKRKGKGEEKSGEGKEERDESKKEKREQGEEEADEEDRKLPKKELIRVYVSTLSDNGFVILNGRRIPRHFVKPFSRKRKLTFFAVIDNNFVNVNWTLKTKAFFGVRKKIFGKGFSLPLYLPSFRNLDRVYLIADFGKAMKDREKEEREEEKEEEKKEEREEEKEREQKQEQKEEKKEQIEQRQKFILKVTVNDSRGGRLSIPPGTHSISSRARIVMKVLDINTTQGYRFGYVELDGRRLGTRPFPIVMNKNHHVHVVFTKREGEKEEREEKQEQREKQRKEQGEKLRRHYEQIYNKKKQEKERIQKELNNYYRQKSHLEDEIRKFKGKGQHTGGQEIHLNRVNGKIHHCSQRIRSIDSELHEIIQKMPHLK